MYYRLSCCKINKKNGYEPHNNTVGTLADTVAEAASQSVSMLVLRGKQSNRQVLSAKQVSNRRECAVRCLVNTACEAANVIRRNDTVTCQMLSRSDAEDDLEDNSDAEYLYSE